MKNLNYFKKIYFEIKMIYRRQNYIKQYLYQMLTGLKIETFFCFIVKV